mgnify:CR=1 FL=1
MLGKVYLKQYAHVQMTVSYDYQSLWMCRVINLSHTRHNILLVTVVQTLFGTYIHLHELSLFTNILLDKDFQISQNSFKRLVSNTGYLYQLVSSRDKNICQFVSQFKYCLSNISGQSLKVKKKIIQLFRIGHWRFHKHSLQTS